MNRWQQARCFSVAFEFFFSSSPTNFWSMRSIWKFLRFLFYPLIWYLVIFGGCSSGSSSNVCRRTTVMNTYEGDGRSGHTFTLIAVSLLLWQPIHRCTRTHKNGIISTSLYERWSANDGTTFTYCAELVTFFTHHSVWVWYTFLRHRTFMQWLMFVDSEKKMNCVRCARRSKFIIATRIQSNDHILCVCVCFIEKNRNRIRSRKHFVSWRWWQYTGIWWQQRCKHLFLFFYCYPRRSFAHTLAPIISVLL